MFEKYFEKSDDAFVKNYLDENGEEGALDALKKRMNKRNRNITAVALAPIVISAAAVGTSAVIDYIENFSDTPTAVHGSAGIDGIDHYNFLTKFPNEREADGIGAEYRNVLNLDPFVERIKAGDKSAVHDYIVAVGTDIRKRLTTAIGDADIPGVFNWSRYQLYSLLRDGYIENSDIGPRWDIMIGGITRDHEGWAEVSINRDVWMIQNQYLMQGRGRERFPDGPDGDVQHDVAVLEYRMRNMSIGIDPGTKGYPEGSEGHPDGRVVLTFRDKVAKFKEQIASGKMKPEAMDLLMDMKERMNEEYPGCFER